MSDYSAKFKRLHRRTVRRKAHVRKVIVGLPDCPRLVVYRSNKHIYAQLVDDYSQKTITGCSSRTPAIRDNIEAAKHKVDQAKVVGATIAELAREKGFERVCFDRNGNRYHGRVKALAEGAREGGLKF